MDDYLIWVEENGLDPETVDADPENVWRFFADDLDDEVDGRDSEFDVFVSYSRDDRPFVRDLVDALGELGVRAWFDADAIGDPDRVPFRVYRALHPAIAKSRRGIAVVTASFLRKRWPGHESRGLYRNDKLAAVVVDGVGADDALRFLGIGEPLPPVLDRADRGTTELAARLARVIKA